VPASWLAFFFGCFQCPWALPKVTICRPFRTYSKNIMLLPKHALQERDIKIEIAQSYRVKYFFEKFFWSLNLILNDIFNKRPLRLK
jgi:hypothetical protein